ncbi:uncharacterized protein LOC128885430 [Hylaeus anthracinus]|uniref:uncharacterized protein LOC128885430 n=1 Tax=Hylaeus anthracinus TaxID=313031 RepID=UPI0023B937B3|nr:uncharacterized protein LOC128885430 [Hylaeus anthracinus]
MVDLHGKDKGNISLPPKLHSYEDEQNKNNPTIINMQRALYSIKITDVENKIKRLENRNDELLEEIETIEGFLSAVDAETAEEISNLSKQMYAQINRVDNLKTQIDTVENDRVKNKQSHEDNVELLNQKYKEKKVELVSQIKVLNAKINTLEDFKKMQTALEEKFKAHDEHRIENNKKVKDSLESISQKFEFDKEMYYVVVWHIFSKKLFNLFYYKRKMRLYYIYKLINFCYLGSKMNCIIVFLMWQPNSK